MLPGADLEHKSGNGVDASPTTALTPPPTVRVQDVGNTFEGRAGVKEAGHAVEKE